MKKKIATKQNKIALTVFILLGVLCIGFAAGVCTVRIPHRNRAITTYSSCVSKGGQQLSYDNAVQFSACRNATDLFLQYSAQDMPRLTDEKTQSKANAVIADKGASSSLVDFLKYDYTGCPDGKGYYKVLREVPERFAEMSYGCGASVPAGGQSYIIAMYVGAKWTFISPTNNMDNDMPSCLLVDMFRISKDLTAQCYQNTGYNDGSLRAVEYP